MSNGATAGLRQVGEFPNDSRQLNRATKNPMDKSTIVSILPKEIYEVKHTIEPGTFRIPPGSYESPSLLIVGSSSWWREINQDQPMLEFPVSSIQVSNSVINDYCNGLFGCNMGDCMPGLFCILGEIDIKEVKAKYSVKLMEVKVIQDNWFKVLVRAADSLWARSNGNPLVISDEMRLGARVLNMNDKPWLKDFQTVEKVPCKACGSLRDPGFPICAVCKAVADPEMAVKLNIKFAI